MNIFFIKKYKLALLVPPKCGHNTVWSLQESLTNKEKIPFLWAKDLATKESGKLTHSTKTNKNISIEEFFLSCDNIILLYRDPYQKHMSSFMNKRHRILGPGTKPTTKEFANFTKTICDRIKNKIPVNHHFLPISMQISEDLIRRHNIKFTTIDKLSDHLTMLDKDDFPLASALLQKAHNKSEYPEGLDWTPEIKKIISELYAQDLSWSIYLR